MLSFITQLFSEKKCFGCENPGHFFCPSCRECVELYKPYCYFCKKPSDNFITHDDCLSKESPLRQVIVLTRYRNTGVKKLLKHAKFYGKYRAYEDFVSLGKELLSSNIDQENTVLIPIPIPFFRKWKRGYNQTDIIAQNLSKNLSIPVDKDTLGRTLYVKQQSHLSQSERLKNLKWSFVFKKNTLPKDTTLYLIDDVASTWATLLEAAKTLREWGFQDIRAIVLASD